LHAYLNSSYETGYKNPSDEAIRARNPLDISAYHKLDEVPYDFIRKRLRILVSTKDGNLVISKGTLPNLFSVRGPFKIGFESGTTPALLFSVKLQCHQVRTVHARYVHYIWTTPLLGKATTKLEHGYVGEDIMIEEAT
jgi:hypothetical protein